LRATVLGELALRRGVEKAADMILRRPPPALM